MACSRWSTSAWAIVGESKVAINRVVKPTQSWTISSNYMPSQVYTKLQREDSLTLCFLPSFTISRMKLWRLEDFWRTYATWRTTRSCWAFAVLTSTNFLEGAGIRAEGAGLSSMAIIGTGLLSSLISGTAWVPTKVVGIADLDRPAELSLAGEWNVCVDVDEQSAWWSSWWSLLAGLGSSWAFVVSTGPRKVHQDAWSKNTQILRFLSKPFRPIFIRILHHASAKPNFYPNLGLGLKIKKESFLAFYCAAGLL